MKKWQRWALEGALLLGIIFISYKLGRPGNKVIVDNSENNEIVRLDECEIVTDTLGNIKSIWYGEDIYTLDVKAKSKL